MKKSLFIASFLAIIALPSITFAAWYNPFTWFQKTPVSVSVPEVIPTNAAPVALPIPKPVITNTITVEDPKLQSQINELAQNNTDLQIKLSALTSEYNVLVSQNASLVAENTRLKTQISTSTVPEQKTVQENVIQNVVRAIKLSPQSTLDKNGWFGVFPVTFTNNGDSPATIKEIDYVISPSGFVDTSVVNSNNSKQNSINVSENANFLLPESVTVPANGSTTVYINTWYTQSYPSITIQGIITSSPNTRFVF